MHATARKISFDEAPIVRPQQKHILILGGLAESLTNFQRVVIQALVSAGHRVSTAAGEHNREVADKLATWGASFHKVPLARAGMNPLTDVTTIAALKSLMQEIKPDVFVGYTVKPVAYGLVAARMAGVPSRFAMITGLGYAFTDGAELKRRMAHIVATEAYRFSLRLAHRVIFQNADDRQYFFDKRLLRDEGQAALVDGSGVDTSHFSPAPLPTEPTTFLMIARLLRDKGVYEYVEAARIVRRARPDARFVLLGPFDPNPAAIKPGEVEAWVREGVVEYRGAVRDVRPHIASSHVCVLPSYREGSPRTVLEAMAMGRAIITTDVPGCRQTIERSACGILIEPRNALALTAAMTSYLNDPARIRSDGIKSRERAVDRFDLNKITAELTQVILNSDDARRRGPRIAAR